jgi:pyruvate kinase
MALCRAVYPIEFIPSQLDGRVPMVEAVEVLKQRKVLFDGQRVLITKGDFTGPGGTNEMKIWNVGDL